METKDNKLGIFIAISKNWPEEQRKKYLEQLKEEAKGAAKPLKATDEA